MVRNIYLFTCHATFKFNFFISTNTTVPNSLLDKIINKLTKIIQKQIKSYCIVGKF